MPTVTTLPNRRHRNGWTHAHMKTTTPDKLIFTESQRAHLERVRTADILAERTFISLRVAMGNDKVFADEVKKIVAQRIKNGNAIGVTAQQAQKGLTWLHDQAWTPSGKVRKHNRLGEAQLAIIKDPSHFTLDGFHGTGYAYLPVWRLHGRNGESFAYVTGNFQGDRILVLS